MSQSKKHTALLINFYWPPSGGPGVHRWLRFSQFFKKNNWDLHVYCPENAAWPIIDEELLQQIPDDITIIRRKIFEPHKYLGKKNNPNVGGGFTRKKKETFFQKIIVWVRGNLFVPDARVFWIKPSIRFLKKYLKNHPEIDTIISSGPPHSMHLIALGLKKKFPKLKWIADFRDPWTEIDFYQELNIGKKADLKQKRFEKEVLKNADLVISIGENCAEGLSKIGNVNVEVFTNGFIFPEFDDKKVDLDTQFNIVHFGSMSFPRNPEVLWKAIAELIIEKPEIKEYLKVQLFGPVDFGVFESAQKYNVESYIQHIQHVSHSESLQLQRKTNVLLLVANKTPNVKGILTGKFFEYLGAKRPILSIGEANSDLETAINYTESGVFIDYSDVSKMKNSILNYFEQFLSKKLYSNAKNVNDYSSEEIITKLLDRIGNLHS